MIAGFFMTSNTMIHAVSARNSSVRKARVMEFTTDYAPLVNLLNPDSRKYVAMICNGLCPFPDYLTAWCKPDEELSEFEIKRIDSTTARVKLYMEKEGF